LVLPQEDLGGFGPLPVLPRIGTRSRRRARTFSLASLIDDIGHERGEGMANDPRTGGRRMVRALHVAAALAVLSMVACSDRGGVELAATLRGDGPVGTGVADIEIGSDLSGLCWDITGLVGTVDAVTAMHIHAGAEGQVGPVVVEFLSGNSGCLEVSPGGVTEGTLRDIAMEPSSFYVDVHSELHPEGAVRGQLGTRGEGE
jgi:CHRD domain